MSDTAPAVPADAGTVMREVRGLGGVPWRRLWGYLRPNLGRFGLALVGLVLSSVLGLAFPLVIAELTATVVEGADPAGLDRSSSCSSACSWSRRSVASCRATSSGWWGSGSSPRCGATCSAGS